PESPLLPRSNCRRVRLARAPCSCRRCHSPRHALGCNPEAHFLQYRLKEENMFPSKSGMKVFGGVLLFGVLAYNRPLLYSCFHQSSVEEGLVSVAELGRLQSVKRMLSTGAPVESRKGM